MCFIIHDFFVLDQEEDSSPIATQSLEEETPMCSNSDHVVFVIHVSMLHMWYMLMSLTSHFLGHWPSKVFKSWIIINH